MITFTCERTGATIVRYVDEMSIQTISTLMYFYEDTLGLIADTTRMYR